MNQAFHDISHARCLYHADREAAVRCPSCRRFFCRECVVEHDDRFLCAACVAKGRTTPHHVRSVLAPLALAAQCIAGVAILWWTFSILGALLVEIPSDFHEGEWASLLEEEP